MPSTDFSSKKGMTLVEVMVSVAIFGLLSGAIWGVVFMQGRSYRYNHISNANVQGASFALNRIVYGNSSTIWGLRVASRAGVSVSPTGVVGPNGATGWSAVCRHNIPLNAGLPALLQTEEQVITFNPIARTLTINGNVVGQRVADAYFTINSGTVSLGLQVETENGGLEAMVETRVRLRNS